MYQMQEKNMGHICPIGRSGVNVCCTIYMKSYRVSRNYYNIVGITDSCYHK